MDTLDLIITLVSLSLFGSTAAGGAVWYIYRTLVRALIKKALASNPVPPLSQSETALYAEWREALAALEAAGKGDTPKAVAFRNRIAAVRSK